MTRPNLSVVHSSNVTTAKPIAPTPRSAPECDPRDILTGDWWGINADGDIWSLQDIRTAHDLPGAMFIRAGSMSRQAAARVLALLIREMLEGGSTH